MGNAEERAGRLVGQAFDFPAVGQDDLLHDRQPQAGAFGVGGEVGLENLGAVFGGHAGTVVGDFDEGLLIVAPAGADADDALGRDGLDGVEDEVEERLAQQLFVRLDDDRIQPGLRVGFSFPRCRN